MKLYWYAKWGRPEDAERDAKAGALVTSNDRMEHNMEAIYNRGKTDGHPNAERDGIIMFGQVMRDEMEKWTVTDEQKRDGHTAAVPMWALEKLLNDWNIPDRVKE